MDQRRLHRVNPDFDPALCELLHEFDDRQHGADLYRVIARHGNINTWLWIIHTESAFVLTVNSIFSILIDFQNQDLQTKNNILRYEYNLNLLRLALVDSLFEQRVY